MSRDRLYRSDAVVIKRSDLGEADKILTLYTPGKGKLRVVAKGVRRPVSKLGGHVELFTHSKMLFAKGRNLDIVTQSETLDSFKDLREDLNRISHAYYVAELLDRFTEDCIENYPVYKLLLEILQRLSEDRDPGLVVRYYELRLLGYLGYRPELQQCVHCAKELTPAAHFFSPPLGGVVCQNCGRVVGDAFDLSLNALKVLRHLQRGDYLTCSRLRLSQSLQNELEHTLTAYIKYLLQKELKSVEFIHTVKEQAEMARR